MKTMPSALLHCGESALLADTSSGGAQAAPLESIDHHHSTAQIALRVLMMLLGFAGLAADRSLFSTILSSCVDQRRAAQSALPISPDHA